MKKAILNIFIFLLILFAHSAQAGNVIINTKLDSTVLLMGKQTTLNIQIVQDKGVVGHFLNEKSDTLSSNVEVSARLKADTTDLDNNRIQINQKWIIQSFDSGLWVIPALKYAVGKDTFSGKNLNLKVIPVKVDSLKSINDFKGVVDPPFHFFDYLPDFIVDYWWIFLLIILAGVAGLVVYLKKKKVITAFVPKKKEVPPYDEAINSLMALKEEKLWQAGQDKEYYTRLIDILRSYIDRRFQINAMEMTSSQIIDVLRKNDETKAVNDQLKQILEIADIVKFAKVRPLPDDNEASFQRAMRFVEDTKPAIVTPELPKDAKDMIKEDSSNKKEKEL